MPQNLNPDNEVTTFKDKKDEAPPPIFMRIIFLIVGIFLTWLLYKNCLHCTDCNIVVIIFIAIIALACFIAFGLPVEKIIANEKIKDIIDKSK